MKATLATGIKGPEIRSGDSGRHASLTPSTPQRAQREHVWHVDLIRIAAMVGVVSVHSIIFTEPSGSIGANAAQVILHGIRREVFFFITAFVLFYATSAADTSLSVGRFWRRRYPLVVAPYVAWTLIYWLQAVPWPLGQALRQLGINLATGWFHLYFLLVTMQLYAVFPLLAWLIRRTRGHHGWLLAGSALLQIGFTWLIQYGWSRIPSALLPWFDNAQNEVTSYQFYFVLGGLTAAHLPRILSWLRRHQLPLLLGSGAALLIAEGWYVLNLGLGQWPEQASGFFQPATILTVLAGLVSLFLLGDWLAHKFPMDGRLWGAIQFVSRSSFGIYLGHMVWLQLLLLTPLGSTLGIWALPGPLKTLVTIALVLGSTLAMVAVLQRTPLSELLTGRPRLLTPQRRSRSSVRPAARGRVAEAH